MEKITELLNTFSLENYVPKLDSVLGWVQWLVSLAVRVGPICMLVLGLIYLFLSPREANYKAGFRTYFGMGSVFAWNVTQRLAGILMAPVGLVLTIIAFLQVNAFPQMDLMAMGEAAFNAIKGQVVCAAIVYGVLFILAAVLFTRDGQCRLGGNVEALLWKLVPKAVEQAYQEEPQEEVEAV